MSQRTRYRLIFIGVATAALAAAVLIDLHQVLSVRARIAYVAGTLFAPFIPSSDCHVRTWLRASLLALLYAPNLVVGHGVGVLPAWLTLFHPTFPGIMAFVVLSLLLSRIFLAMHRDVEPGHPVGLTCRQIPSGNVPMTIAVVGGVLVLYPI